MAVEEARRQGKYLFMCFHRGSDHEVLLPVIRDARERWRDQASFVEVNVDDPADRKSVV